ncbi:MAG TPA: radical SAM protein [Methanoregulaceae archaeon]|nr:radical SAM protein [Methanoregulaceae archaeon]HQJ87092.1 radical SAM protein [Methanoregulaceae archaeon]
MSLPAYRRMPRATLLDRVEEAWGLLESCRLCIRRCGVNRLDDERGWCGAGVDPRISGFGPHFGEERPLVGRGGSGTIFFSHCTMGCIYCQNYETSHLGWGEDLTPDGLAAIMLRLERAGCGNINLVSPTHYVPQILKAVEIAAAEGLSLPLVYNTGTSESPKTLRLLDGVVDIYLPDAKYADDRVAIALSALPGYVEAMKRNLVEMQRQVGDLVCEDGIAVRGLIVRHLVLPDDLSGGCEVMRFIAREVSQNCYVNIMDQYRVVWGELTEKTPRDPCIRRILRPVTPAEVARVIACARKAGLHRFAD